MEFPSDYDEPTRQLYRFVKPYTRTSKDRVFMLARAVEYVVKHRIPGDIVECGVWRGGSMMVVAKTLVNLGVQDRKLILFDTFEGMSAPTDVDKDRWGVAAETALKGEQDKTRIDSIWAYSQLDEVKSNMQLTGYKIENMTFIKGKVEDTLPAQAPAQISILRLDTDWYESTYHELKHLYSRLSIGGVLIIDDYGDWEGARRAVDQFLLEYNPKVLLNRIDDTGRLCIKLES